MFSYCRSVHMLRDLVKIYINKLDSAAKANLIALQQDIFDYDQLCILSQRNPLQSAIVCIFSQSTSIHSLFYSLISDHKLDLSSKVDIFGNTLLHLACLFYDGDSTLIEYMLANGRADPLCINGCRQTPLTLLRLTESAKSNIDVLIAKLGQLQIAHPIESYVNIIVLGHPGVGKSTLVKVLNDRHHTFPLFRFFRSLPDNKDNYHRTAGIVPHTLNDEDIGRVIIHDLAGQVEYYSSHMAVLDNLLKGSSAVFIVVVSLTDEKPEDSLRFWLHIAENVSSKSIKQQQVIGVASHEDEVRDKNIKSKKQSLEKEMNIKTPDIDCQSRIFCLDCRKLGGGELNSFITSVSRACQSIRKNGMKETSLYCHMLYDFLYIRSHHQNVFTLNELITAIKGQYDCFLPTTPHELFDIVCKLSSTGLILHLGKASSTLADKVWIVANKSILLKNLNGILFAPKSFKEHISDLVSKTGIVKLSKLCNNLEYVFKTYDPDMIVQFLEYMDLSHEISKDFMLSSNLALPSELGETEERYLFIPALIESTTRHDISYHKFQFGWCLRCSHDSFFLPRFIHLIILHLLKYTEDKSPDDPIDKHCHIWNNGIYWKRRDGVSTLVELSNKNNLILLMFFESGCYEKMTELRKSIIREILQCKSQTLAKTDVTEFVIDNQNLLYPQILDKINEFPLFEIYEFCTCYCKNRDFVLSYDNGKTSRSISVLLCEGDWKEQCESIFAGRSPENNLKSTTILDKLSVRSVYSILLQCRPQLLDLIADPERLAIGLVSENLLSSKDQHNICTTTQICDYKKASMIMDHIVGYFKQHDNDNEQFLGFCQVIDNQQNPGLRRLVEEMKKMVGYISPLIIRQLSDEQEQPQDCLNVFDLLRDKTSQWNEIGRKLGVSSDHCKILQTDSTLSDSGRLEKVLKKWYDSSRLSTLLKLEQFVRIMSNLGYSDVVDEVKKKLQY